MNNGGQRFRAIKRGAVGGERVMMSGESQVSVSGTQEGWRRLAGTLWEVEEENQPRGCQGAEHSGPRSRVVGAEELTGGPAQAEPHRPWILRAEGKPLEGLGQRRDT